MAYTARFETLVDIYEESINSFASRELFGTKVGGEWKWVTYGEFAKAVERFRGALSSLGIKSGDAVAIISNNRVEWAVGAYAVFGLGAAWVPMYEAMLEKDWEYILHDCEAKLLIAANSALFAKVRHFIDTIPSLEHIVVLDGGTGDHHNVSDYRTLVSSSSEHEPIKPKRDDTACILYTSGTTGNPKGVTLSHYNIASNVSAVHQFFPMDRTDRSLSFLPWAHAFGQTCELHCLLSLGGSMAIAEGAQKIIDNLAETKPTILISVPRIFNKIYLGVQHQLSTKPKPIQSMVKQAMKITAKEREGQRLTLAEHALVAATDKLVFSRIRAKFGGRLRYALSGGAALSRDVAEFIDSLGIMVYEGYGLTETSPIATANCPGERRIGSVGRAIPGVRVQIDVAAVASEKKGSVAGREEGEIVIYGPNVMQGYYKRPHETAEVFTDDGGFRTGDMGYIDPWGYVHITGRIKEQYKLENGKYVVPTPLEDQLKLSQYVLNAMVYGDNRPYNVALIVANMDTVREWAAMNAVSVGPNETLLDSPEVKKLFREEIQKHGEAFKAFEEVREFALISQDFTTDNGMLTPKMSLKRRKVLEVYGALLDSLYATKQEVAAQ